MQRNRNPSDWQRMMRGRLIDEGIDLNEHTDAALTLCADEIGWLLGTLKGIAEYCSGDDRTLGAIERLVSIRNTAERAIREHEQTASKETAK